MRTTLATEGGARCKKRKEKYKRLVHNAEAPEFRGIRTHAAIPSTSTRSSYSRAEAIEDGVLIDLTAFHFRESSPGNPNVCQEAGLKFPVAITSAAYDKAIGGTEDNPLPPAQDLSGRTYDVVSMLRFAIARSRGGREIHYKLNVWNWITRNGKRTKGTKHELVTLKAVSGPGDNGEPVITIMLPHED